MPWGSHVGLPTPGAQEEATAAVLPQLLAGTAAGTICHRECVRAAYPRCPCNGDPMLDRSLLRVAVRQCLCRASDRRMQAAVGVVRAIHSVVLLVNGS